MTGPADPAGPAVLSCALNGVLTDPSTHPVPVTPAEMATEARRAWEAGATVMHVHLRDQAPGQGHRSSWDLSLSAEVQAAIRDACPGVILNHTTGVVGPGFDEALACVTATRPEIAACNAGSLNYLKVRSNGEWAWPPMLFDNPVEKVERALAVMAAAGSMPEFECFDTGIVRSVAMFRQTGLFAHPPHLNLVMGVASGMPADPDLLPILMSLMPEAATWQVTAIGRAEVWALHARAAEMGGHLRTGLEDTFYLPSGARAASNGALIEALAAVARDAGRAVASADEARALLRLPERA